MGGLATSAPSPLSPKAPGELHGHERGGPLGPAPSSVGPGGPPTFRGHVLDVDLVLVGHVAEDGEDGEPRHEAGDAVDGAGEQGVPGGGAP